MHGVMIVLALPTLAHAQGGPNASDAIAFLIERVGGSGCRFVRNGEEHPSGDAANHLRRKLASIRRELSPEQFIEHVASKSSMSGRPYTIRCDGRPEVTAGEWLRHALQERGG